MPEKLDFLSPIYFQNIVLYLTQFTGTFPPLDLHLYSPQQLGVIALPQLRVKNLESAAQGCKRVISSPENSLPHSTQNYFVTPPRLAVAPDDGPYTVECLRD
jgi:hypothetical protein